LFVERKLFADNSSTAGTRLLHWFDHGNRAIVKSGEDYRIPLSPPFPKGEDHFYPLQKGKDRHPPFIKGGRGDFIRIMPVESSMAVVKSILNPTGGVFLV